MRAVVVYESMFGNTHQVAERIGDGLRSRFEVVVEPVGAVTEEQLHRADLLVVGAPTHGHGLSSDTSRRAARQTASSHDDLELEPEPASGGAGLGSWLDRLPEHPPGRAAAFDTRVSGPALLTGRASRGIARRLETHGYGLVAEPESFLVDRHNHLIDGETDRATAWGLVLAASAGS